MDNIERMKIILKEDEVPYFTDKELEFYINENDGNVDAAIYQCLILKSENTTLSVSGLTTADTSSYFKRIAVRYKPKNSGVLK